MSFFRKLEIDFPAFRKLEIDLPAPLVSRTSESFRHYEKLIYFGQISVRLQQTTTSAQQFVYFSGLLAAAIVSSGLVHKEALIVILAPYALTFAITYQLQLYTDVECLTTLKEYLEKALNNEDSVRQYLESVALSVKYRNRPSIKALLLIYIVLITGIFTESIRLSHQHQARWKSGLIPWVVLNLHVANVAGVIFCCILLVIAGSELVFANPSTLKRIKQAHMGIAGERYVASTTFRRSGAKVPTPTWIVPLDGGRVGFWTSSRAGKYKRLCNDPQINMQPCNVRGRVRKESRKVEGTAEMVTSGPEFDAIQAKVRDKYGFMVPLFRFINTFCHLGKGPFPYGNVGVVVTFSDQPQGSEDVKDA
jgi:PPOX class probable F420-dependent enzyme